MTGTTMIARQILFICQYDYQVAICETEKRFINGDLSEGEAMRVCDVIEALCARR